jgi:type II restriction enzyme
VDWDKVFDNMKEVEVALNTMNYLIGKENFDDEFRFLLKHNPEIVKTIPILIVRDGSHSSKFKILIDYKQRKLVYEEYDFTKKEITEEDIDKYLAFVRETGLKNLIASQKVKSLVDYMIGVEAGLDSHGRKNRGGNRMEDIVEFFIGDLCEKKGFEYLREANAAKIKEKWNIAIPINISSRKYDFLVYTGKDLFVFETNFYGGGGSKLKSTAGEYKNLSDYLRNDCKFVWITDGYGWKTTWKPLRETFNHIDYLFSLNMLENEILNYLIN